MKLIRKHIKPMALGMVLLMVNELVFPLTAHALTGGPSQPEVQSFEPVGTSEMVDLFTGDFTYNIPLLDIGGYPINLAYHGGPTMEEEASWVGLGWNINPGVINRNMRGLPDDFNGEKIAKEFSVKPQITVGTSAGPDFEFFGLQKNTSGGYNQLGGVALSFGIVYNNYKGIGYEFGMNGSRSYSGMVSSLGLGLKVGSLDGADLAFSGSFKGKNEWMEASSVKMNGTYSSRGGWREMSLSPTVKGTTFKINLKEFSLPFASNNSSEITFESQPWIPSINHSHYNNSYTTQFKTGFENAGFELNGHINHYHSEQGMTDDQKSVRKSAFGYYYSQNGTDNGDDILLDFSRDNNGGIERRSAFMPVPNFTYDLFSVTGQGAGGTYRLHRSDFGILHDDYYYTTSTGKSATYEIGGFNTLKGGVDVKRNFGRHESGKWGQDLTLRTETNHFQEVYGFVKNYDGSADGRHAPFVSYEEAYFKNMGEKTPVDASFYKKYGGYEPVRINIKYGPNFSASTNFSGNSYKAYDVINLGEVEYDAQSINAITHSSPRMQTRHKREMRNQVFTPMTAGDAKSFGTEKEIRSYDLLITGNTPHFKYTVVNRENGSSKLSHHFSELSVTNTDGSRYVYGVPAYNNQQVEKTFAVDVAGGGNRVNASGLIKYKPASPYNDDTKNNQQGTDNFYSSISTPSYAHSYLLSDILSADYSDLSGNGPSDDDLGSYVKFNYGLNNSDDYKWRTPYKRQYGSHCPGLKTDPADDKCHYMYGEKEVWYLTSIETKNQIAFFFLSDRLDGMGVSDKDGGQPTSSSPRNTLKKLDRIVLYSKQDFIANEFNATPIKVVHFDYEYSLCQGIENNSNNPTGAAYAGAANWGKLTLKKVWFTYGSSEKGQSSPYVFNYEGSNIQYNPKAFDRWGVYKPNKDNSSGASSLDISNSEFPYTQQIKDSADSRCAAWCLTKIDLPSGGVIQVQYESDDYAYVQNLPAMQMVPIIGVGTSNDFSSLSTTDILFDKNDVNAKYEYIFFNLLKDKSGAYINDMDKYIKVGQQLYFNVLADIDANAKLERVPGYAEVTASSCNTTTHIGCIKVKNVLLNNKFYSTATINPIAKTIMRYAKDNCPKVVYPSSYDLPTFQSITSPRKQAAVLLGMSQDVLDLYKSQYRSLFDRNIGSKIKLDNPVGNTANPNPSCWIRLNAASKFKFGGGQRVKKITMSDNWQIMNGNNSSYPASQYGQEYDYTMVENGQLISSGVAAYEPSIGNDENPWHQPVYYKTKLLDVEYQSYQELPAGEEFFPGASVGYRKVVVRNIGYTSSNVTRHTNGYSVNTFYTAHDFPTMVSYTDKYFKRFKTDPYLSFFNMITIDKVALSQGFCVEINDMHGKPKSQFVYAEDIAPYDPSRPNTEIGRISGSETYYKCVPLPSPFGGKLFTDGYRGYLLDNTVDVVKSDLSITQQEIGVTMDAYADMRYNEGMDQTVGISSNIDLSSVFPIPSLYPSYSNTITGVKTAVTNKVISRYGIVDHVVAYQEGSKVETKNLLWDAETGEVLLTSLPNEFNDPVYSFIYPAHWVYSGMGPAYSNIGLKLHNIILGIDEIRFSYGSPEYAQALSPSSFLHPGDECILRKTSTDPGIKVWVYDGTASAGSVKLNLIDVDGNNVYYRYPSSVYSNLSLEVIRSGHRNQQNEPIAIIQSMVNPIVTVGGGNRKVQFDVNSKVINTSASEYSDTWKTFCAYLVKSCVMSDEADWVKNFLGAARTAGWWHNNASATTDGVTWDNKSSFLDRFKDNITDATASNFLPCKGTSGHDAAVQVDIIEPDGGSSTIGKGLVFHLSPDCCLGGLCCDITMNYIPDAGATSDYLNFSTIVSLDNISEPTEHSFIMTVKDGENKSYKLLVSSNCYNFCSAGDCSTGVLNSAINPYVANLKGVWRKKNNYAYLTPRSYNNTGVRSKTDGTYSTFSPFWDFASGSTTLSKNPFNDLKWVWKSEVTEYSPFGPELENKNALNIYSAALYSFNGTLPIAAGSNLKYNEIGYDGMEDYGYTGLTTSSTSSGSFSLCDYGNWSFIKSLGTNVHWNNTIKHTGKYSLKVDAGYSASKIVSPPPVNDNSLDRSAEYEIRSSDCIKSFLPDSGKFIISGWVKVAGAADVVSYNNASIAVDVEDDHSVTTTYTISANVSENPIIETWQQFQGTFTLPLNYKKITFRLIADPTNATYFDDIRVFPNRSNMKSYAYNPITLKVMAELDENNYATFYEYDQEGILIRVKKETVKGIQTLKETRTSQPKYIH